MNNLYTKDQMPSFTGSAVIATKPKPKYRLHRAAMLSFHIPQKITLTTLHIL
jgi:hypothetical protein